MTTLAACTLIVLYAGLGAYTIYLRFLSWKLERVLDNTLLELGDTIETARRATVLVGVLQRCVEYEQMRADMAVASTKPVMWNTK